MLYVSSYKNNIIKVKDVLDLETESITEEECMKYIKAGLEIQGVQLNGDNLKINSIEADIARHKLLNDGWKIGVYTGGDIWVERIYQTQSSNVIELQGVPEGLTDKELVIPDYIVKIGASCLFNRSFDNVRLSKNLVAIGATAFTNTHGLRRAVLPECFRWAGNGAFSRCYDLQYVEFPEYVYSLNRDMFEGCSLLRNVVLPKELEVNALEIDFFKDCRTLKHVNLGETNIIELCESCFQGCKNLESIDLSKIKRLGDYCFMGCLNLREVTIPRIETIPEACFAKTGLEHITISEGVRTISDRCFLNTDIKTIEIPESVEYIGRQAFGDCTLLEKVVLKNDRTDIEYNAFHGCSDFEIIKG